MPRARRPTAELELSGAFKHNPSRRRVDPVPRGPIGNAPKTGPITFKKAWNLIVSSVPDGVLADRDRVAVEIAAHLYVQFRSDPINMHPAKLQRLTSLLAQLGLTPADASRVVARPVEKANPFAE